MLTVKLRRYYAPVALFIAAVVAAALLPIEAAKPPASELNSAAILIQPPDKIQWSAQANGAQQAVLVGDPSKPGMYIYLVR